jgi:hypothetical protein
MDESGIHPVTASALRVNDKEDYVEQACKRINRDESSRFCLSP